MRSVALRVAWSGFALAACSFAPAPPNHQQPDATTSPDALVHHDARPDPDAPGSGSGVAVVQQKQTENDTANTITATFDNPPAAGHVVMLVGGKATGSGTSVSGVGSAWTLVAGSWEVYDLEIWYTVANGTDSTITYDYLESPTDLPMFMMVSDWTGLAAADAVDASAPPANTDAGSQTGGTARAGSGVTTHGPDVVVLGVSSEVGGSFADFSPEVALTPIDGSAVAVGVWYEIEDDAGTYDPGVTSPGGWDAAVVAFKQQ